MAIRTALLSQNLQSLSSPNEKYERVRTRATCKRVGRCAVLIAAFLEQLLCHVRGDTREDALQEEGGMCPIGKLAHE